MMFKAEGLDRRDMLASMAALPFAFGPSVAGAAGSVPGNAADRIEEDIQRYIGFGAKASGGAGDTASGEWIGEELAKAGYVVERTVFDAPYFDQAIAELRIAGRKADLIPQAIVQQTSRDGVKGRSSASIRSSPSPFLQRRSSWWTCQGGPGRPRRIRSSGAPLLHV